MVGENKKLSDWGGGSGESWEGDEYDQMNDDQMKLGLRGSLSYSWKHIWCLSGFFIFADACPLSWNYFLR